MYRKRERTQNWSLEEKMYLLELVRSRLDVLENKRIDSASSTMKGLAWQDIHAGFAARFGPDRDAHRVREQWRRMKGQARTEMVEFAERVRNYGPEVANQRRPSVLAEDVWKTLELARKLNMYQQPFGPSAGGRGGADDTGSGGAEDLDDAEGDVWNPMEPDVSFLSELSPGEHDSSRLENGLRPKKEVEDNSGDGDPGRDDIADGEHRVVDGDHPVHAVLSDDDDRDDDDVEDDDLVDSGRPEQGRLNHSQSQPSARSGSKPDLQGMYANSSSGERANVGLVNMLRPKVELSYNNDNDVPDIDTSMVPQGLSITAVRGLGNSFKRRAVQMDHTSSPVPSRGAAAPMAADDRYIRSSLLELKRQEQRRRAEMLESEHRAKMQLLRVEHETAVIRRRIALLDEARTLGEARETRALGREAALSPATTTPTPPPVSATTPPATTPPPTTLPATTLPATTPPATTPPATTTPATTTPATTTPAEEAVVANGINGKTDGANHDDCDGHDDGDRAYSTNLGDLGSGAGKGGGGGGSVRDAGGSFGKREAALEGEYFYKKQQEQLKQLKHDLTDEISFHEEQIKRHQEAIQRHKERVTNLDKEEK